MTSLQEPADVMREEQRVPGATVGPLSCHLPLLHAASDSSEPMGAASLGQNTQQRQPKNFLGLRSRRGARRPPGKVERPMRCGRDSKGMGYIALLCDLRQVAQLL